MKANPEIVRILESAMADAKSGKMRGLVICGVNQGEGGGVGYYADGINDVARLMNQMSFVADRWSGAYDESKEISARIIPFPKTS